MIVEDTPKPFYVRKIKTYTVTKRAGLEKLLAIVKTAMIDTYLYDYLRYLKDIEAAAAAIESKGYYKYAIQAATDIFNGKYKKYQTYNFSRDYTRVVIKACI